MKHIDIDAIDKIRVLQRPGAPDILKRIVDLFVSQTPESVETIKAAVDSADYETVRQTAHSIKSSAAYVGALEFSAKMAEIEKAAAETNTDELQSLTAELNTHSESVIAELLGFMDKAA